MKKITLGIASFAFVFSLMLALTGFKAKYSSLAQDYRNININDIKDCILHKNWGKCSTQIKLTEAEIDTVIKLLNSSSKIVVLDMGMPHPSSWIYIDLKSGKSVKFALANGGFCYSDKGISYKIIQPKCKELIVQFNNKFVGKQPDILSLDYIVGSFRYFGIDLKDAGTDYKLKLNNSYGNYYYYVNDVSKRVGVYVYNSPQEMQKGLKEYESKSLLINIPYRKVYHVKNVIIVVLNNNNTYPDMIAVMIGFINDVPDNLFPIDSNKIIKAIGDYKFKPDNNFDYVNDEFILLTTCESDKIEIKDYEIKKNEALDIAISKDEEFIISFPAFNMIMRWNINNSLNKDLLRFDKRDGFNDYNSFYFKGLKEGCQKINFQCTSFDSKDSWFDVTLNIIIK